MNILIVNSGILPVTLYGGTERVIWYLGKELTKMGHRVSYLVKQGSKCDFATIIPIDPEQDIIAQIPENIDVVHFNFTPKNIEKLKRPYIITMHGNSNSQRPMDINTVFVSRNHASRFGSDAFVHNGLDWEDYTKPNLNQTRSYFHFLGNAAWRVKNVKGAIEAIKATKHERLKVLGGVRFNIKMGIRFTFSPRIGFCGMVGGQQKDQLLNGSKGLVFPVRWHEPFGLAIIESLYYGCPVFGTPYGSLTEIVGDDVGYLSAQKSELINAIENSAIYSKERCHAYAMEMFNSRKMALSYLEKYEHVLSNQTINTQRPFLQKPPTDKFLAWGE